MRWEGSPGAAGREAGRGQGASPGGAGKGRDGQVLYHNTVPWKLMDGWLVAHFQAQVRYQMLIAAAF